MDTLKGAETEERALPKISKLKQPQRRKGWHNMDLHFLQKMPSTGRYRGRLGEISEPSSEPSSLQQQQAGLLVWRGTARSCGRH